MGELLVIFLGDVRGAVGAGLRLIAHDAGGLLCSRGTKARQLGRRKFRQGGRYRGKAISCEILSKAIDALDQSLQQAATEHEGATVAKKGKCSPGEGHAPDGQGDVHKDMHEKRPRAAEGE